ncbi:MAG: ABC transporter permease [Actinomyces sp.]|uniref:ABC transporter permease n=1 Tax=Actinomyces sp. oral taxon 448 TaxID=712124 RepID=UPI0025BB6131|nr:ABC transporter permease [Actinomyces sp. oral taxon 448]
MRLVFRAELIKLKRSSIWLIALALPLLAVITGTINLANNPDALNAGWASFTSQVTLFYSLLFYSMGIALLTATAWRMEHRGTNWNLLLTGTRRPARLVLAKVVVIAVPVAFMQLVLVGGTVASGVVVLRLDGAVSWQFAAVGALSVIVALPLIAFQSMLSMLLKSFAVPVAICLLGCVASIAAVTSDALHPLSYALPQALNTRTLNLGSTAFAGSGGLTGADVAPLLGAALVLTATAIGLTTVAMRVIKLR